MKVEMASEDTHACKLINPLSCSSDHEPPCSRGRGRCTTRNTDDDAKQVFNRAEASSLCSSIVLGICILGSFARILSRSLFVDCLFASCNCAFHVCCC